MIEESSNICLNVSSSDIYCLEMSNLTFSPGFQTAFSVLFYRYLFITMYIIIFVVCIVGNTLVLIVTANSVRMKTRTNFFLANLAAADLCVGILCIIPNLQTSLYFNWLLGKTMCKVYYFAESFSLCVSVLLLAVIAVERYVAVMHPLRARGLFTNCRMHAAQILIWVLSAVYNIPLMAIFDTFQLPDGSGGEFCIIRDDIINLRIYFTINFIIWYTLPLITMSVAYTIISWTLWHSGTIFNQQKSNDVSNHYTSTKMVSLVRDNRSIGNVSSSSSGGAGSARDGSQSVGSMEGDINRHNNGNNGLNTYDISSRCCYSFSADSSDQIPVNNENYCNGCGVATTRFTGSRNDIFVPGQAMQTQEYGGPVCWSWPAREDVSKVENDKNAGFSNRNSGSHSNKNINFENLCLASKCLHFQKPHQKRQNGVVNQTSPVVNSKQRLARRSFHSDYASDSSPGNNPTYETSSHRHHPTMSERVLSSRRKVVRLLVLIFLTFALCVLPHHIRLLMFYWNIYPDFSFGMSFFPPLAFMSLYLNSALNPVLYSLLSESFRRSLRECLRRFWQRGKSCLTRHTSRCFKKANENRQKTVEIRLE